MKKNKAINTLTYTGMVTLSQYRGRKKVVIFKTHNKGGTTLFDFFVDCLTGNFDKAKQSLPTKVMFVVEEKEEDKVSYRPVKPESFTHILTIPERVTSSNGPRVRYSFIIPKDRVATARLEDNLYLGLYNDENSDPADSESAQKFMALCKVDLTDSILNAALVVDWELYISNPVVDTITETLAINN